MYAFEPRMFLHSMSTDMSIESVPGGHTSHDRAPSAYWVMSLGAEPLTLVQSGTRKIPPGTALLTDGQIEAWSGPSKVETSGRLLYLYCAGSSL